MAYLESAVVVYLREIYYPHGFSFPLQEITPFIYFIEIGREISTIIMLFIFSYFMSNNKRELFAFFSYNFGVWDIWYYLWLKIMLDWPESFFTWDILFLIPIPWVAPVIAPILVSISLILAALIILNVEHKYNYFNFRIFDWIIEICAGLIIIISFLFQTETTLSNILPSEFPWLVFIFGMCIGFFWFIYRVIQTNYKS
ncbi:MAG: hypothetical protein KAS18_00315 [Calditrichia bacterium]|nr:hypothetical protein [Calditrichia bacterium]